MHDMRGRKNNSKHQHAKPHQKNQDTSEVEKSWVNPIGVHYHKSWWLGFFETWKILPSKNGVI